MPCLVRPGHGYALIGFPPDGLSDFGLGAGARIGDTTCLASTVPELRASTLKQIVLVLPRRSSRPRLFGTSSGCWPSLWQGLCLRLAPSPPSSPKIPDFTAPAVRRRCNTIERDRS